MMLGWGGGAENRKFYVLKAKKKKKIKVSDVYLFIFLNHY